MRIQLYALAVTVSMSAATACGTGNSDDATVDAVVVDPDARDVDALSPDAGMNAVPPTPTVRAPFSGFQTGSLWSDGAAGAGASPLRPVFRWSASAGATTYRLEVDDSCATVAGCTFPSPEIDVTTVAPTYTPATALAVSQTVPVGRRYYVRIRACNEHGCSEPTSVRYVDVGRVDGDLDGDGYPELLLTSQSYKTYVFRGTSTGIEPTSVRTLTAHWSLGATLAGDLDGDGFGDVVIGNHLASAAGHRDVGEAYIYRGSATGLSATPSQTIASPFNGFAFVMFGLGARGIGDVNGDGYADLVIGMPLYATGRAYVFFGSPSGVDPTGYVMIPSPMGTTGAEFGHYTGAVGDVDGDGLADFAVSDTKLRIGNRSVGAVAVYAGGAAGPSTTPIAILENPEPTGSYFGGTVTSAGDVDGDGYGDLITSPLAGYSGPAYPKQVYVYRGGAGALDATHDQVIANPLATTDGRFAGAAVSADIDHDGRPELLVGDHGVGAGDTGSAYLFEYDAVAPRRTFLPDAAADRAMFGASVAVCDLDSDGFGEVIVGQLNYASSVAGAALVYRGGASGPAAIPSQKLSDPDGLDHGFPCTATCRR
jgi:hypothetical protein